MSAPRPYLRLDFIVGTLIVLVLLFAQPRLAGAFVASPEPDSFLCHVFSFVLTPLSLCTPTDAASTPTTTISSPKGSPEQAIAGETITNIPTSTTVFNQHFTYTTSGITAADLDARLASLPFPQVATILAALLERTERASGSAVSLDLFYKQIDTIYNDLGDDIRNLSQDIDDISELSSASLADTTLTGTTLFSDITTDELLYLNISSELTASGVSISGSSVGIGTTTPNSLLTVDGTIGATSLCDEDGNNCAAVTALTSGTSPWSTVGSNIYYSVGNISIGTSSPTARLSVQSIGSTDILNLFETDGEEVLTVLENGKVGIGTSTPSSTLSIVGDIDIRDLDGYKLDGRTIIRTYSNNSLYVGALAGAKSSAGGNTGLGYKVFEENLSGTQSVAVGMRVLDNNTSGNRNTGVGFHVLSNNETGNANVALGHEALRAQIVGIGNTALGYQAGANLNAGSLVGNNVMLGTFAGGGVVTGVENTIIGANTRGLPSDLSNNIIIADGAGNQRIRVNEYGYVGIGTTSPISLLSVQATGTTDILNLFETDGQEVFTVLENGAVGIGTTNPGSLLELYQPNRNNILTIGRDDGDSGGIVFETDGSRSYGMGTMEAEVAGLGNKFYIGRYRDGQFYRNFEILTNGEIAISENLFANDNVSVGTTTKIARLNVQATGTTDILNLFETDGQEVFTVLENGKVGIGTTSPGYKLDVFANSTNNPDVLRIGGSTDYSVLPSHGYMTFGQGLTIDSLNRSSRLSIGAGADGRYADLRFESAQTSNWGGIRYFTAAGNDNLSFFTYQTERVRIDNSGNVGFGTTSPTTKLTIAGIITPDADNTYSLGNSSYRWSEVFAANGTVNTSDERLKDNITALKYGLAEILILDPVIFSWKDNPEQGSKLGLVAQDVQDILPEIVHVGEDKNKTLGIRYTELTAVLINAIQEMWATIEGFGERFTTNELCVGEVCVTEEEFKTMVVSAGQEPVSAEESEEEQSVDGLPDDLVDIPDDSETDATTIDHDANDEVQLDSESATSSDEALATTNDSSGEDPTPPSEGQVEEILYSDEHEDIEVQTTETVIRDTPQEFEVNAEPADNKEIVDSAEVEEKISNIEE